MNSSKIRNSSQNLSQAANCQASACVVIDSPAGAISDQPVLETLTEANDVGTVYKHQPLDTSKQSIRLISTPKPHQLKGSFAVTITRLQSAIPISASPMNRAV